MLYFAYGSNLHLEQMARRCPAAEPLGALMLPDWQLVFRGVADVVRVAGAVCPGGVWRITSACERALDRYEGFQPAYPDRGMYRKEIVPVDGLPDGETEIMLYAMNSRGIYPPSDYYFDVVQQGYRDFGLRLGPLRAALRRAYDDKRPSHIERKRTRRMGRPALAARPPEPPIAVAPQRKPKKKAKKAARHDPWAKALTTVHGRPNKLSAWLRARQDRGEPT